MLAISQALLCRPKLMVVDELSLGLAPFLVKELMARIREMRAKFNLSVLLIEQDASSALAIADYGYIMEGGRIVYEGAADKLRSHGDVQEFYLGSGDRGRVSYPDGKQDRRSRRWFGGRRFSTSPRFRCCSAALGRSTTSRSRSNQPASLPSSARMGPARPAFLIALREPTARVRAVFSFKEPTSPMLPRTRQRSVASRARSSTTSCFRS